jgi:cytochrome d ubiquinol oxidase subunit II
MSIELDLAFAWYAIIVFSVLMYVVMDGFDLGVGLLFPLVRDARGRDIMTNTIAPVWDGNETWLVLGGGGLFAVFPLAYSVALTALYAPLIAMLLALVFRGVAFEFRFKDPDHKVWWDRAFFGGSAVATFAQGVVLGAFVQGIETQGRLYAGGWFDWLTPFSVFTGVALMVGYALLGAGWLVMKTEGELQSRCFEFLVPLAFWILLAIFVVSMWTPLLNDRIAWRWFSWPNIAWFSPVPLLVAVTAVLLFRAILRRNEHQPFIFSLVLFLLAYAGLGISLFPNIVPPGISYHDAAAPDESLKFLMVGAVVLIPVILAYTGYGYWVFRGKVRGDEGYH